jgi:hypothetical protein
MKETIIYATDVYNKDKTKEVCINILQRDEECLTDFQRIEITDDNALDLCVELLNILQRHKGN